MPVRADSASGRDRRVAIVRVAYQLIHDHGLEGLRFADVARGAGINNGTLLYYFAGKDALVRAVGEYLVAEFSTTAAPSDGGSSTDPLSALRHEFADARERLQAETSIVYTELLARAQRDESVAGLLRDIDAAWRGWLMRFLERGKTEGLFRSDLDTELAATVVMAVIRGVGVQALVNGKSRMVEAAMDVFATSIERWITTSS